MATLEQRIDKALADCQRRILSDLPDPRQTRLMYRQMKREQLEAETPTRSGRQAVTKTLNIKDFFTFS